MQKNGIKISPEEKLEMIKIFLSGKRSIREIASGYCLHPSTLQKWIAQYKAFGVDALSRKTNNSHYSPEQKQKAVQAYLTGEGSYLSVAVKYSIRSVSQLKRWVKMYNDGVDFSHKVSGGTRMNTSRKITYAERVEIVKYCLENDCNYNETANIYGLSYQQVRNWVKKYTELGEAGLEDRRGKRKAKQDPRTDEEKMQIEIEQLKHQLYLKEMECDLLKKARELERIELFRK